MIGSASHSIPPTSMKIIVGNKNDQKIKVRPDEITEVCVKYEMVYCEVSGKNAFNIEQVNSLLT